MNKHKKHCLTFQIKECKRVIKAIKKGEYKEASILIRYYLNDASFIWYKDINSIIDDQITNLFFDIETDFKKNLTIRFFEGIINELKYDIENGI